MEAVALHDFVAKHPSELSFRKGDKLLILNFGDRVDWYDAEKDGEKGHIPGNYVRIEKPSWYMGRIARATAENMLRSNEREGAFLVRLSESSPKDFSLSVKCGLSVQHFRILRNPDGRYLLWQKNFYSINELVENYRHETVSRTSTILLCDLDEGGQFIVEAMFDFNKEEGDDDQELEFKQGEIITVFDSTDENWWGGRIGERSGFFPATFVKRFVPNNFENPQE